MTTPNGSGGAATTDRREALANWLRAALLDQRTDIDDRVSLTHHLDRLAILPAETWMTVATEHLDDDTAATLVAAVLGIIARNPHLAEAYGNWKLIHHCNLEDQR